MGMPEIPDLKPIIDVKRKDVVNLLLLSVALEELGLAAIINAEAEKLQEILEKYRKSDELFEANEAVIRALKTVIKKEILLQFKFDNILDLIKDKEEKDC